jgi:hypothetical protein
MNRIRKGYKVYDYHVELDFQDGQRLQRFCAEADMKYSSVFRRSLRKFLDVEEQKLQNEKQLFGELKK